MKIILITLLFCSQLGAQSFLTWSVPTEKGEIEYLLFTNSDYEKLLQGIEIGDLGGLTEEILTQRKLLIEQQQLIDSLEKRVLELENEKENREAYQINDYELVAFKLYFEHNQGLEKSRTTVNKAKEEGYTTYDEIYKYSLEILKIR